MAETFFDAGPAENEGDMQQLVVEMFTVTTVELGDELPLKGCLLYTSPSPRD